MKNIAFFSGDITRSGGTERVATIVATELKRTNKYNISFVSLYETNGELFYELDEQVMHYSLYNKRVRGITHIFGIVRRLRKFIEQNDIDIIVDIDGILDLYSIMAKRNSKLKIVSWEHFNIHYHPNQRLRNVIRKYAAPRVDAIVTLTKEDENDYKKIFGVDCPVRCICNPFDKLKNNNEYNDDSKIILSVGRLTYQKGFDMLVEVAGNVLPSNSDWQWIVVGDGEEKELLERKTREKGLEKQLFFVGKKENVDDYYYKSAFYVMTSRYEGLPMTLLECKTHNLPIVSFKCKTGPSELVIDGVNGFLVESESIEDMAEKMKILIKDKSKRKEFSDKSGLGMEKYEKKEVVKNWILFFDEL